MSTVFKLSKPVMAHGQEITELTLREPTVTDTMDLGMPYVVDISGDEAAIAFKPTVLAKYVTRLATVPMSTIKALPISDWMALQGVVQGFFGQSGGAASSGSQSEPSTSPGSTE